MTKSRIGYELAEEAELETPELLDVGVSMVRCECGHTVKVDIPRQCSCGKRFAYWKDIAGKIKRLDQMDLGHLNNCVRMLAEKAEDLRGDYRLGAVEQALDIFYAEIGSRDKEITQLSGIQAAIFRGLAREE